MRKAMLEATVDKSWSATTSSSYVLLLNQDCDIVREIILSDPMVKSSQS